MKNLAIFISGSGSNMKSIAERIKQGKIDGARLALIVSSSPEAGGIEYAENSGIKTAVFTYKGKTEDEISAGLIRLMKEEAIDLVILAGFVKIIPAAFVREYRGRILNIHPSLIPNYCGKGYYGIRVHEEVLRAGEKESGATVHFVDEGVDTGAIILQKSCPVLEGDSPQTLQKRVLEIEHEIYSLAIQKVLAGEFAEAPVCTEIGGETMKTALISVSDKTGAVEFASSLSELGYRLLSTGGTKKALEEAGLPVIGVSEVTGFPEILDGRVKTLHPKIHGALLARRDLQEHMEVLKENEIDTIDLVCVNLYPFETVVAKPDCKLEDAIENIDIGGPSMLRSAAKNCASVLPVCDPGDYDEIIAQLKAGKVEERFRLSLAKKVYAHTSHYDAAISKHLAKVLDGESETAELPEELNLKLTKRAELRYGENPNQKAAVYSAGDAYGIVSAEILNGKAMSYNNYSDAAAALACLKEFESPAAVCLKHATPCGVCEADNIYDAYMGAYKADPVSVFGGIIALNRTMTLGVAEELVKIFCEIVIAPDYDEDALSLLKTKKNLRVLRMDASKIESGIELKSVSGGYLLQSADEGVFESLDCVTDSAPSEQEMKDLIFAMKVVKHAKSNAIVTAKNGATVGIGTGQVSRVWATENAIKHSFSSVEGGVLASDAFFPFPDSIELALEAGITAIIQPGGSIRDEEVIRRANELGIKMVISKARHFKH